MASARAFRNWSGVSPRPTPWRPATPWRIGDVQPTATDHVRRTVVVFGYTLSRTTAAGVTAETLKNWLDSHPDFFEAWSEARWDVESEKLEEVSAEWLLSRSLGYNEKTEHDVDADHTHTLGDGWRFVDDE